MDKGKKLRPALMKASRVSVGSTGNFSCCSSHPSKDKTVYSLKHYSLDISEVTRYCLASPLLVMPILELLDFYPPILNIVIYV